VGDVRALAARLAATPGVVDHGLFEPELTATILVATGDKVARHDL
jgi:ribose 5-phosphate isomerase A